MGVLIAEVSAGTQWRVFLPFTDVNTSVDKEWMVSFLFTEGKLSVEQGCLVLSPFMDRILLSCLTSPAAEVL